MASNPYSLSKRLGSRVACLALIGAIALPFAACNQLKDPSESTQTVRTSEKPLEATRATVAAQNAATGEPESPGVSPPQANPFQAYLDAHGNTAAASPAKPNSSAALDSFRAALKAQKSSQPLEPKDDPFRDAMKNQKPIQSAFPFTAAPGPDGGGVSSGQK